MPITELFKTGTISQDAIAGYRINTIDDTTQITDNGTQTSVATQSTSKAISKALRFVYHQIRALKRWMYDEQLTVSLYQNFGLLYPMVSTEWMTVAYDESLSDKNYPVRNGNIIFNYNDEAYSVFVAPETGDYNVAMQLDCQFRDLLPFKVYVSAWLSYGGVNEGWKSTNIRVTGGANMQAWELGGESITRVETYGAVIIRLKRGDRLRFGVNQVNPTIPEAGSDPIIANSKIIITKQKFYPTLRR